MILCVKKFSQSEIDNEFDVQLSKANETINEEIVEAYNLALKLANEIVTLVKNEFNDEKSTMFNSDYCYVSILINSETLWITQLIVEVDAKEIEDFDNEMLYVLSCGNININYNIANETFINKAEVGTA